VTDRDAVRRIVLATGKVALDAMNARRQAGRQDVAVVRIEQLYPWPAEHIAAAVAGYPGAEDVVWLQEEPENMGAWSFVRDRLHDLLESDFRFDRVTRVASGSPATGSHAMHELEQADLAARALGEPAIAKEPPPP
jgi:2-oxoglutarate dehydrogenase complex dehydrogenase (E1) component-like enzyme